MGDVRDAVIDKAISQYSKKIPFYWPFSYVCLSDVKAARTAGSEKQKELEGKRFLVEITPGDFVMLLDERGKQFTSRDFSEFIARKSVELPRSLIFVIGGPYGFSQEVYNRADALISLSKMTFPHELVRLFFVEQLYRACTIYRGEPYHHD